MTSENTEIKSYVDGLTDFSDKVVVITGALGQIGSAVAHGFKLCGATVVGLDVVLGEGVSKYLDQVIEIDITNRRSVRVSIDTVVKEHGTPDILINNAGIAVFEPYQDRTDNDMDDVFNVNIKGVFNCTVEFAAVFNDRSCPRSIVNIASLYGVVSPDPRIYIDLSRNSSEIYGATKAGVIQMTKYFAVHLAKSNIRVNAVSPGGIFNPVEPQGEQFLEAYSTRCPMGRIAKVSEMVCGVMFLASRGSSYVNGHNLVIDGGFTAW